MKTKTLLQLLIFAGLTIFSCSKEDSTGKTDIQISVFDTLKGNWNWYSTYYARKGIVVNEYAVILKFIEINIDSSIVYETYKNGVLLKNGNIKISSDKWGEKIIPNITPFYIPNDTLDLKFISKDTIELKMNCRDCPFYYFNK